MKVTQVADLDLKYSVSSSLRIYFSKKNSPLSLSQMNFDQSLESIPCYGRKQFKDISCSLDFKDNFIGLKNYQKVDKGQAFEFYVGNMILPSFDFDVQIVYFEHEIQKLQEKYSSQLTVSPQNPIAVAVVDYSSQNPVDFYSFSSTVIESRFELIFTLGLTSDITSNNQLLIVLPSYSNQFVRKERQYEVQCFINELAYSCVALSFVDKILIEVPNSSDYFLTYSNKNSLRIKGLTWPREVIQSSNLSIIVIQNNN